MEILFLSLQDTLSFNSHTGHCRATVKTQASGRGDLPLGIPRQHLKQVADKTR